ncbi:uncharacterized protein METZ01_LOCUS458776, partial [marine metagenome]
QFFLAPIVLALLVVANFSEGQSLFDEKMLQDENFRKDVKEAMEADQAGGLLGKLLPLEGYYTS